MSTGQTPMSSVLLIGGPDAGKSNYLFRLWLAIYGGASSLVMNGFPDEIEYLRTGLETLMVGKFAGRTSEEVLQQISIPVKSASDASKQGMLSVPDVPGERIEKVYLSRNWDAFWEERIVEGCGCLVFIRAGSNEVVRPLDYAECLRLFGATLPGETAASVGQSEVPVAGAGADAKDSKEAKDSGKSPAADSASHAPPTDVVLTDWLQFLRAAFTDRVGGLYRPRIGIVISAWDGVPVDQQGAAPIEYLADNFPMLRQFVETNTESFEVEIFGLSILGGDLEHDADFRTRVVDGTMDKFGFVVHSLNGSLERAADVTLPVAWALGWPPTIAPKETRP